MPYYLIEISGTVNTANVVVKNCACEAVLEWPRVGSPDPGVGTFNGSSDTRWDPCAGECFPSGVV